VKNAALSRAKFDGVMAGIRKTMRDNDGQPVPAYMKNAYGQDIGCLKCDGYGNLKTDNGWVRCDCKKKYFADKMLLDANIPEHLLEVSTLDNFQIVHPSTEKFIESTRTYIQGYTRKNNKGLLLWGRPGRGKTHLAIAILQALITKGCTGYFTEWALLLMRIKAGYTPGTVGDDPDWMSDILSVDVLVLDDLGRGEKMTEWVLEQTYNVIHARSRENKTLIITTQLDYGTGELMDVFGASIVGRIKMMTGDACFNSLPDFRGAGK